MHVAFMMSKILVLVHLMKYWTFYIPSGNNDLIVSDVAADVYDR